jgi:hypothetical protein
MVLSGFPILLNKPEALERSHPDDSLSRTIGTYIWRQVLLVDVSVAKLSRRSP